MCYGLIHTYFHRQGTDVEGMDASNPLPAVQQPASPNPSVAQSSSGQTGAQTSTSIQGTQMSVMMQQAVAMQQYQFQQALMVQQAVIAQQAATRAAVLKSATEVAAARAAEISKQLKGSDTDDKKPPERSKSRSVSKSASRSPSRSKSRSKSPIRYRRGRSGSRSPIRYRRDYYSSYRASDYHGYRGHNYRGYYRGSYNDHSRFRYGRERDYNYRRQSRSRARRRSTTKSRSPRRSRSRGRRRSRTLSPSPRRRSHTRSPRHSRKKSISPRVKREGTKSRQTPKRSASREVVSSPSASSTSISISPSGKNRSRSPGKVKGGGDDTKSNVDRSSPTELSIEVDADQNASNAMKEHNRFSVSSPTRNQSSSSPVRSLSISLDNQSYQKAENRVDAKQRSPDEHYEQSMQPPVLDEKYRKTKHFQSEESYGEKTHYPTKSFSAEGHRVKKLTKGSDAIFDEESESDEVLDDWRDDLKTSLKGKGLSAYKDRGGDRNEDTGKSYISEAHMPELSGGTIHKCSDSNLKHDRVQHRTSSEEHSSSTMATGDQDAISDKDNEPLSVTAKGKYLPLQRRHVLVSEDTEELMEGDTEGNEIERDGDEDAVFEGPKPANAGGEERTQRVEAGGDDSDSYPIDSEFVVPIADKMPPLTPDKKKTQDMRVVEDNDIGTRVIAAKLDGFEEKGWGRSRSRDGKKHEGELSKHEKRRDRHKKHKKKHKHESVDQDNDDDGSRRRHKRKHREGEHGQKERKKGKHKHRTKSVSVSAERSLSADEGEVRGSSGGRKKSSRRHKTSKRDVSESIP